MPALEIEEWLTTGDRPAVTTFERGTAYVVVFFSAGQQPLEPLLNSVAALSDMFRARGVRVLGLTGEDARASRLAGEAAVRGAAASKRFAIGWDRGDRTRKAIVEASGQRTPPLVYVIDTQGRLAWYGVPGGTSAILEGVLSGTWDLERTRRDLERTEDLAWLRIEVIRAQRARDAARMQAAGERLLNEFASDPEGRDELLRFAAELTSRHGLFDLDAHAALRTLSLRAAEAAVAADPSDPRRLRVLARAQAANARVDEARATTRAALEKAGGEEPADADLLDELATMLRQYAESPEQPAPTP